MRSYRQTLKMDDYSEKNVQYLAIYFIFDTQSIKL